MASRMRRLLLTASLLATTPPPTTATPAVVFPFNSQVPTAARINQPYLFQFSASTFAPHSANFTYTLSSAPPWLALDSASRTLSGTPDPSSAGSTTFTLTAADPAGGAAHMPCTLVVTADALPTLQDALGPQLANLSAGGSAGAVRLRPATPFDFAFRLDSFIDRVQRRLLYYATLADHTPLPAWLRFDAERLAFGGEAPALGVGGVQVWRVLLIASDVPGFAGVSAEFEIRVGEGEGRVRFEDGERVVGFRSGGEVEVGDLGEGLVRDGERVGLGVLRGAEVEGLPGWMQFDEETLGIRGRAPEDAEAVNVTVKVRVEGGDTATVTLRFVPEQRESSSLFAGTIGTLEATGGEHFEYTIPSSVVPKTDATLRLVLPTDAKWLQFDSSKREMQGDVPSQTSAMITATLNAMASDVPELETQIFSINVKAMASRSGIASESGASTATPTESSNAASAMIGADGDSHNGLSGGAIAGLVIGAVLAAAILFALLYICCQRRRRPRDGYARQISPSKPKISRPVPPIHSDSIAVTTELHTDVEKAPSADGARSGSTEKPPQIDLNLPIHSARVSKWTHRFSRNSLASSLGNGEDMIRADTNIPEWGQDSAALQTPHDSFSVPAQMARVSRQLSDLSPSKRALRRLRARRAKHQSENSLGLGIGLGDADLMPGRADSRRKANSLGLEATLDRSSCASITTRGTSVLSARPSDFPRPPTGSSFGGSRSIIPTLSATDLDTKRRSIRLVGRSDSINDERPMQEKRQSFIHKRGSANILGSPLWGASLGYRGSSAPDASTRRRKQTTYSESSSLQPTRSSTRLSQRLRASLIPGYPRVIDPSTSEPPTHHPALAEDPDDSSEYYTTSASSSTPDLAADRQLADEMALPRHERSWVLPNEASPTPPPPSLRHPSSTHVNTSSPTSILHRGKPFRPSASRSISPLAAQALDNSLSASARAAKKRGSRLSEPMALASNDSLSKVKRKGKERPRLVQTSSGRPVSVEDVKRLSSFRAERVVEEDEGVGDVVAGAEEGERERVVTGGSGKAFI